MQYISALDGYLKALQRLCGAGFVFGARGYPAEDDIDNFMRNIISEWGSSNEYTYSGYEKIESKDLFCRVEDLIFNGVIVKDRFQSNNFIPKMILEDINEYYGLASTSLDEQGEFHPLLTGPVYKLNIGSCLNFKGLYFLVKINKYFVITYLKAPKPDSE